MIKVVNTPKYKYQFNTETGMFVRWGETVEDDPTYSPLGPEIADIEISTVCSNGCKFCYKSNTTKGKNMSLDTFKKVLDLLKGNLTQIAFGIGDIGANPDLKDIFTYCREQGIVPNVTINGEGLTDDWVSFLSQVCGAIAVSHYSNDVCFNAVKKLTDAGMKQVNIHKLLSKETLQSVYQLMYSVQNDNRLLKLNAVVLLSVKQKGRGVGYTPLNYAEFEELAIKLLDSGARFGFDSCTANKFLRVIKDTKYQYVSVYAEPCESGLFSAYVNTDGVYFPCSFSEGVEEGIDLLQVNDFMSEVWDSNVVLKWREKLLNCSRGCPLYNV